MKKTKIFFKRWLVFKPLYYIEKMVDPPPNFGLPKYPRFSAFVYKVAKWSMN